MSQDLSCRFCDRAVPEIAYLFVSPGPDSLAICNECIGACYDELVEQGLAPASPARFPLLAQASEPVLPRTSVVAGDVDAFRRPRA